LALVGAFRSRAALEAENTILRHQLNVLRRQSPKRPTFGMLDRLIFAGLYRLAPKVLGALAIVKPETVIKWLCLPQSSPSILVMQSAQDWATKNVPDAVDGARDRCIFLQG
jgi:hypothetical protein